MSYAVSAALQAAIFDRLSTTSAVTDLVGSNIFDALPLGEIPELYAVLGAERVRDASDQTGGGATHDLNISVVTTRTGFQVAKGLAGAITDALVDADLSLTRGRLVNLSFYKAVAARIGTGDARRIDLTFRARVCDG